MDTTIIRTATHSIQVWRGTKHYRNGTVINHEVITALTADEECLADFADDKLRRWAEMDGAGQNYGYDLDIEIELDPELIKEAIADEIKRVATNVSRLQERLDILFNIIL
jgi:hypothetical protein